MRTDHGDYLVSLPSKRMAVGVILRDTDDRILLVLPTYRDRWQLPGGVVEAHESPPAAAAREVEEELGLNLRIGRPLVIRWLPPGLDPRGAIVIDYDGGILAPEDVARVRLPPDELSASRFVAIDDMAELTSFGTANRVMNAVDALHTGGVVELDDHQRRD